MHDASDLIEFALFMLGLSIPILAITIGRPLGRAWAARLGSRSDGERADLAALEARMDARLTRLESYVQTMSVEVERLGEANRYLLNAASSNPGTSMPPRAPSDAAPLPVPR